MNGDRGDPGEEEEGQDEGRSVHDVGVDPGPADRRDGSADPRTSPSGSAPDGPIADSSPPPDPGDGVVALALGLALVSLLTGGAIAAVHGAVLPATGAAGIGLGFAAIGAGARTRLSGLAGSLADGWAEHRLYVWFATALFSFGIAIGGLLVAAGVDLTELLLELLLEEFDEEELVAENGLELSASVFVFQNTPPFLAAIFGALTLGLVTVLVMVVNGVLVGNLAAAAGSEVGIGPILLLLAPHGIFELPALFVAAGIGFRLLHRGVQRIAGSRENLVSRAYLSRTILLAVFAWLVLVLAAFVEAYLTEVIAEAVYPGLGE